METGDSTRAGPDFRRTRKEDATVRPIYLSGARDTKAVGARLVVPLVVASLALGSLLTFYAPDSSGSPVRRSVPGSIPAQGNGTWHIGISVNCNNRNWCTGERLLGQPMAIGGLWGSLQLNADGTGRAEFTACSHASGAYGFATGATHVSVIIHGWTIGPAGTFIETGGTETYRGGTNRGSMVTFTSPVDTGIPAIPGHYTALDILGNGTPHGVAIQIQVSLISS